MLTSDVYMEGRSGSLTNNLVMKFKYIKKLTENNSYKTTWLLRY